MASYKGILHFPKLFVPKAAQGSTDKKYGGQILIAPNDPQVAVIHAAVNAAKLDSFPSGYTGTDCCWGLYEEKIPATKEYHDPRFIGWYVLSFSAKEEDKPRVVDMAHQPVINPGDVHSGMVVWVSVNITGYIAGRGGVGGWLNGVMVTAEEPPMGRLDNKPTVEQMFGNVGAAPQQAAAAAPPAPNLAPQSPAPQPQYVMTAKAGGATREALLANGQGWTDELLVSNGMMEPPTAVAPSFA